MARLKQNPYQSFRALFLSPASFFRIEKTQFLLFSLWKKARDDRRFLSAVTGFLSCRTRRKKKFVPFAGKKTRFTAFYFTSACAKTSPKSLIHNVSTQQIYRLNAQAAARYNARSGGSACPKARRFLHCKRPRNTLEPMCRKTGLQRRKGAAAPSFWR